MLFATLLKLVRRQAPAVSQADEATKLFRLYNYVTIKVTSTKPEVLYELGMTEVTRELHYRKCAQRPSLRYCAHYGDWAIGEEALSDRDIGRLRRTPCIVKAQLQTIRLAQ